MYIVTWWHGSNQHATMRTRYAAVARDIESCARQSGFSTMIQFKPA